MLSNDLPLGLAQQRSTRGTRGSGVALHVLGFAGAMLLWSGPFLHYWFRAVSGPTGLMLSIAGLAVLVGTGVSIQKINEG